MAKVFSIQVKADFLVLADDEQDAMTIASVLTDGIDSELPASCVADLYPYLIPRQDEDMRKQCVNYEGHADALTSEAAQQVSSTGDENV
jgi:hypothetical protein